MKLVTYQYQDQSNLGVLLDHDRIINLSQAVSKFQQSHQIPLPPGDFPGDMLSFLQSDEGWWQAAASTVNWLEASNSNPLTEPAILPLDQVKLAPPLTNPSKLICIGLNYYDHCRETDTPVPDRPVTFVKFPSAIIGPDDTITWPPEATTQVDYEAELALVIRRQARNISAKDAFDYIAGYTMVNDVSARDVQFAEGQWVRAKSFDTFCPLGPYLVTSDEVGDPHNLGIRCRINGQLVQDSNTSELIFGVPILIEFITKTCTLYPGDIISTGTPHGIGAYRKPPLYLKPGDVVEVEIDKLGLLRNPIV